ncbi:hypothetical protein [Poseidonocella sedimentorum]|uniref:Uncharacterized protein n=1 Tax=Poseidonocella sedimentorum TaxID=871652 RepID=A0A1I6EAY5_9RHOB|nr:hypothetical protein [Poseidonocella sedimentorum]SFR14900.1 hypothetical protein SAMN04515673_10951 [Poseidonocella sedimentorum]
MTEGLEIPALEAGVVRVFSLSMDEAEAAALKGDAARLEAALGAPVEDPKWVEVLAVADLEGLGLAGYLAEGQGIAPETLAPDRARLNALEGHVMLVMSPAFGGAPVSLAPASAVTLVGVYSETRPEVRFEELPAGSTKGNLAGPGGRGPAPATGAGRWIFWGALALVLLLALGWALWGR